ncbi:uncharacterized protein LOC127713971 [Mytilus californianus]|uniref:uncharacterized protein LOC127713971 n=1 Tax=Mytilus californianus TaxID=6549 RepID=UPI002246F2B2|nr:uncharacterized protein LOC127713971 [Mytilus californianus]
MRHTFIPNVVLLISSYFFRNSRRKFYVNKSYYGCPIDDGWFVGIDRTPYCTWEKQGANPLFLYTKTSHLETGQMLILTVLIVVSLPQCICVVFQPPQQPVQVVIVEDPGEDQKDFFVKEDRFAARGTDTGIGLGESFPFLSMLFLIMITMVPMMDMVTMVPMIDMVTNEMMGTMATSTTTSTTTQAQPAATPCVTPNCPHGYRLLDDQTASTNCYLYGGGNNLQSWDDAMRTCAMTPGAFLWNPNTEVEANAVINKLSIPFQECMWTGGRKANDGTFVFDIDKSGFPLDMMTNRQPFGMIAIMSDENDSCLGILGLDVEPRIWLWGDNFCSFAALYVCEFPRTICP